MQSRKSRRRLHLLAITIAAFGCSTATLSGTLAAFTFQQAGPAATMRA